MTTSIVKVINFYANIHALIWSFNQEIERIQRLNSSWIYLLIGLIQDDHDFHEFLSTYLTQYINSGLAGAMFWDTSLDDFTGSFCGEGKYPLISMFNTCLDTGVETTTEILTTSSVSTTTPDNPLTTTTKKPTTNGKAGIKKMQTMIS